MQRNPDCPSAGEDAAFFVPERIPVFPLPNVVFFPKTYLPLHIFEARYREMVTDAVAGGQCVGMALLKEGWEDDYYGNPPVFEMGCVGRLVSVQPLPDGRFNILLQGLSRFEICEQFYEKSYRQARVRLKPNDGAVSLEPATRAVLVRLLDTYLSTSDDGHQWKGLLRQAEDDEVLVNSLASYLDLTPLEKQFLMEADSLHQRARRLNDLLEFKLQERGGVKGWG
nr:LON peptidase substrate-binding domain-containing protein [Nitrospirota bacterium]